MKSSSQGQMGTVTSPSPSGVTSVWVGTRPSKDPHGPPPPPPKETSHSAPTVGTETEGASQDGHWKNRRLTTTAGAGDGGEYVVVAVRNSISESSTPFGRRNSTIIPPASAQVSGLSRSFSSCDQSLSGLSRDGSSSFLAFSPPSSSVGNAPPQTPGSSVSDASMASIAYCRGTLGGNSNAIPTNVTSGSEVTGNVLSGSNLGNNPLSDGSNSGGSNHSIVMGNNSLYKGNNPGGSNHSIAWGNNSLYSGNNPGGFLGNTVNGFNNGSELLSSCGNNNLFGNMNAFYSARSLFPSVTSSMLMLPLASSGIGSLFPQPSGLLPDLLASSLQQTLNLCQATTPLQSLKHPQTLLQTTPLPGLSTAPFLPILPMGQLLPPTFPQTSPLLGLAQNPLLPMSSLSPFSVLPTSLPLSSPWLSQPDLQFPAMLSTLLPTSTPGLPVSAITQGTLPAAQTCSATTPVADRDAKPLSKRRSPPPLLHQNPSEAYRARRASLKADREMVSREVTPPTRRSSFASSTTGDHQQEDRRMTSGAGSPAPTTPSPTYSPCPLDGVGDVQFPTDVYHGGGVSVEPCYHPPSDPHCCMRCGKKVYTMEKQVGPVRRVLYHQACFTCSACSTVLSLSNYHHNDDDKDDLNVYCASHKPLFRSQALDSEALLLQQATLTLPRQQMCA